MKPCHPVRRLAVCGLLLVAAVVVLGPGLGLGPGPGVSAAGGGTETAPTARLKDIAAVRGWDSRKLVGYGLVVGLAGTGDSRQAMFTVQSVSNMLSRLGVSVESYAFKVKNVAAVLATAELAPYSCQGDRIDCLVSSIGDAKSLEGGTLVLTPLLGPDGQVYAAAQGPISVGGLKGSWGSSGSRGAEGGQASGSQIPKNHPTVATVPLGATVEKAWASPPSGAAGQTSQSGLSICLLRPDFSTAASAASAINARFGAKLARAVDPATIRVELPEQLRADLVETIAAIEAVEVMLSAPARIVINERTGTVVVGGDVCILPATVVCGSIRVQVGGGGETVQAGDAGAVPASGGGGGHPTIDLSPSQTVFCLVKALSAVGASPRDIIAVLQALRDAGALVAALEVV